MGLPFALTKSRLAQCQLRLTLPCSAGSIERCRAFCLLLSLCPPDLARPVSADRRLTACCQGVIVASRSTSRERYSFANLSEPLELPDLIAVQRESFEWLLNEGVG